MDRRSDGIYVHLTEKSALKRAARLCRRFWFSVFLDCDRQYHMDIDAMPDADVVRIFNKAGAEAWAFVEPKPVRP